MNWNILELWNPIAAASSPEKVFSYEENGAKLHERIVIMAFKHQRINAPFAPNVIH